MWTIQVRKGGWQAVRYVEPMTIDEAQALLDALERWNLGIFRAVML